jgi:NTE family protein
MPIGENSTSSNSPVTVCLSGGGFRATLFHLGAVRRLNELGVLQNTGVFTSVSGGSILNGVLATRWRNLIAGKGGTFTNFDEVIASPIRAFCKRDIRTKLLFVERFAPQNWGKIFRDHFAVPASLLATEYESLFENKALGELPDGKAGPRFVFCATNVQTGGCWQFHGGPSGRMGDFYTGYCDAGSVKVSEAVAASSAFPPGFAGLRLRMDQRSLSRVDQWGEERAQSRKRAALDGYSGRETILTDGGVYDNLGVEPVWSRCSTLLVSDAGRPFDSIAVQSQSIVSRLNRAAQISAEQVGAVRKRWLLEQLMDKNHARNGAVWAINSPLDDFPVREAGYDVVTRNLLSKVRTDLNSFTEGEIGCLENYGYLLGDAGVKSFAPTLCTDPNAGFDWPSVEWSKDDVAQVALARSGARSIFRDVWQAIWK